MGVHDEAIRDSAKGAAVECLLGVANKAYVTKNPKANSWNRWFNRGSVAFCEIREEHIPYEVEKLVKVKKYA